ncbi:MAG: HAD hydrolase-like protein [archaeon]
MGKSLVEVIDTLGKVFSFDRMYGDNRVLFCVDSDGCVDPGMKMKHTSPGPFAKAGVDVFGLDAIDPDWRIVWTLVNEYSYRGCPRFEALTHMPDILNQRQNVQNQISLGNVQVPSFEHLKKYLETADDNSDETLLRHVKTLNSSSPEAQELRKVLGWSQTVNGYVDTYCPRIDAFDAAKQTLIEAYKQGIDLMIVSGTPENHLKRQWKEHGLLDIVGDAVFGRDTASKNTLIQAAVFASTQANKPYSHIFMIGDAPGDLKAVRNAFDATAEASVQPHMYFVPIRVNYEGDDWNDFRRSFVIDFVINKGQSRNRLLKYATAEKAQIKSFENNLRQAKERYHSGLDIGSLYSAAQ